MANRSDYGLLITPDIKLHRTYFKQMCSLIGIKVVYRAPRPDKHYTVYTEIESNYENPQVVDCIFEEHPTQQTLKKLGWVSELGTEPPIISVPYDTPNLQSGALFIIPSGLDCAEGRLFRVVELSNIMIYPASITCKIVPEYQDTFSNTQYDHKHSSFNLLREDED